MSNKVLKFRISILVWTAMILTCVGAMGAGSAQAENEPVRLELVIDTKGIYSVCYTAYIGETRACFGGAADLDGNELEEGRVLEYSISEALLGEGADLSAFSVDFSPFDNESAYELGRTNAVSFPAEYGQVYRFHLMQDENGYFILPEWEEEDEKFVIEIGGNVIPGDTDFSYLHADYYIGDEQFGFLYTCADEDSSVIRMEFSRDAFDGYAENADISLFRIDLYLSYADSKGDEAVLQAMYGNTGVDEFLTSLTLPAQYGQTYYFILNGSRQEGYTLLAAEAQ